MASEKFLQALVRISRRRIKQASDERQRQRRQLHALLSRQDVARKAMEEAMVTCQMHAQAIQALLSRSNGFRIEAYLERKHYQDILREHEASACHKLNEARSAVAQQERLLDALSLQLAAQEQKLRWCEQRLQCVMVQTENIRQDQEDEEAEEVCTARITSRKSYPV